MVSGSPPFFRASPNHTVPTGLSGVPPSGRRGPDNRAMDVSFLGLGLIGGSIARALADARDRGEDLRLRAWSPTGRGPALALRDGVLDAVADEAAQAIDGADLVVLAGPPQSAIAALSELAPGGSLGAALGRVARALR